MIFIVNQTAGNGRAKSVWSIVERDLKRRGIHYKAHFTKGYNDGTRIARDLVKEQASGIIVAVGGDGTIHEVIQALANQKTVLGIIPAGSGNDLAHSLEIPADPRDALEILVRGNIRSLDLGKIGDRYFINNAGIGLDAWVAKHASESKIKRWGKMGYLLTALYGMVRYHQSSIRVDIDGVSNRFSQVWLVAVCNVPYYGGGIPICPEAIPDDGSFQICVIHSIPRYKSLRAIVKILQGKHKGVVGIELFSANKLIIESEHPLLLHTDGEIAGTTPVRIEVHHHSLRVVM